MKPFDLEKAKAGKPVCTRCGRPVRIVCFDSKTERPIVALVEQVDGSEDCFLYNTDGTCSLGRDFDLMMATEKKQGWINVYKNKSTVCKKEIAVISGYVYESEEAAKNSAFMSDAYIGTFPFEWEE